MKIFALNIPTNHPSFEVLSRFGEASKVDSWPPTQASANHEPSLLFARITTDADLKRISSACEERGDWCFVWASNEVLKSIANDSSASLVDFVGDNFDEEELVIRLVRLVRVERPNGGGNFLGVPEEIADELTKKQLIILKALFEAGEEGLRKIELADKIWKKERPQNTKASGFNVHILHLRKKISQFGLMIAYDKHNRVYRLRAAVKPRAVTRRRTNSIGLSLSN